MENFRSEIILAILGIPTVVLTVILLVIASDAVAIQLMTLLG